MNRCKMCGRALASSRAETCSQACRKAWSRRSENARRQAKAAMAQVRSLGRYADRYPDLHEELRALLDNITGECTRINATKIGSVTPVTVTLDRQQAANSITCLYCGEGFAIPGFEDKPGLCVFFPTGDGYRFAHNQCAHAHGYHLPGMRQHPLPDLDSLEV